MKKIVIILVTVITMILNTGCGQTPTETEVTQTLEVASQEVPSSQISETSTFMTTSQTKMETIVRALPTTEEETTVPPTSETVSSTEPTTKVQETEETTIAETAEPTQEETEATEPPTTSEPRPAYTFTDMVGRTMYVQKSVNIRDLPSTDGNIITTRGVNAEVWVTGQCNETGWYRIDIEGQTLYVSNGYVAESRYVEPTAPPASPKQPAYDTSGFVYYTVAGQWPERAYEEYLYAQLKARNIAWWYPYAVAQIWQESRWNPNSYNGVDAGICQFNEASFERRAAHHANVTGVSIWDPYDSLYVYSFYIRDILVGCNYDVEAALSYYIKGHWNDRHDSYINAVYKWYNALEAK